MNKIHREFHKTIENKFNTYETNTANYALLSHRSRHTNC